MPEPAKIQVTITADGAEATLTVPAGLGALTPDSVKGPLQQAGVLIDAAVEKNIAAFIAAYGAGASPRSAVIAAAVPPVHGEDGRLEWNQGFDPSAKPPRDPSSRPDAERQIDHHLVRHYVRVKSGDAIGVIHDMKPGTDGRDVRGRALKARAGTPAPIKLHSTLTADATGRIIAQSDGVLMLEGSQLSIIQTIQIKGGVDFSTGHVMFAGNVNIKEGVKSGFNVNAGGDLHIGGLIEISNLQCEGSFVSRGGMAGHGQGTLTVERDAQVTYLEAVNGLIKGDLTVERELISCTLIVGRDLKCSAGTILGGEISVTGSVFAKVIGSPGCTPTTLVLGDLPFLQASRQKAVKAAEQSRAGIEAIAMQMRPLKQIPKPSAADQQKLERFGVEMENLSRELGERTSKLNEIDAALKGQLKLDVHVSQAIHPNVMLRVGAARAQFQNAVKGPIWIGWDSQRQLICKSGSGPAKPLSEIAKVIQPPTARPSSAQSAAA